MLGNRSRKTGRLSAGAALLAATALALSGCAGGTGGDEAITIVFTSHNNENASDMIEAQWWMNRVVELSDNAVEFETHYSGSLVPAVDALAAVKDGRVDTASVTAFNNPAELPLSQVAGVPFVTDNSQAFALAFLKMFEENEAYRDEYLGQGVRPLFFTTTAGTAIGTKEPVESVADLSGLRIRSGGLQTIAFSAAGAEPIAIGFDEVYQAAERGVIDGWATAQMTGAYAAGLFEITPHFTNPGLGLFTIATVLISEDFYQSLPESVRAAMEQATEELAEVGADMLMENGEEVCTSILDNGGTVSSWSEERVAEWKAAVGSEPIDAWVRGSIAAGIDPAVADDFFESFNDAVAQAEATSAYVDITTSCSERG